MTIWEIIALAKAGNGSAKSMLHFKGSVLNESALPESGNEGDTYLVDSADSYFAWDGEGWTDVGQLLSMDDVAALFDQVEDAGDEQVARIVAKGQEVEESIPEDYSELSGDVGALKSAMIKDIWCPNAPYDLNNFVTSGRYLLPSTIANTNEPDMSDTDTYTGVYGAPRLLIVDAMVVNSNNTIISQILLRGNAYGFYGYYRRRISGYWSTWQKGFDSREKPYSSNYITSANTNLNNLTENGVYIFLASNNYTNEPVDDKTGGGKTLIVDHVEGDKVYFTRQTWIRSSAGVYRAFYRQGSGANWNDWTKIFDLDEFNNLSSLASSDNLDELVDLIQNSDLNKLANYGRVFSSDNNYDLNTFKTSGTYIFTRLSNITNAPTNSANKGSKALIVDHIQTDTLSFTRQTWIRGDTDIYEVFYREGTNGVWKAWFNGYSSDSQINNRIESYSDTTSFSGQGDNIGTNFKVLTYNVAHYNNDTSTYLNTTKQANYKKMLSEIKPDIVAIQEDRDYISSDTTRPTTNALYNPIFPYVYGLTANSSATIRSKIAGSNSNIIKFSNGRWLAYQTFTINNKTLLFASTHLVANYNGTGTSSADSISARLTQYTELMDWVNGDITLNQISDNTPVQCPNYEWSIICGDFNTITASDKTNLITKVTAKGFTMANGGWLGWVYTDMRDMWSLDNVVCSPKVIINSIKAHNSLYDELYSDHVPFEVSVTLT